jgi:hypothetical protein
MEYMINISPETKVVGFFCLFWQCWGLNPHKCLASALLFEPCCQSFCFYFAFGGRILPLPLPRLVSNSTSRIAGITGMHHHAGLLLVFDGISPYNSFWHIFEFFVP